MGKWQAKRGNATDRPTFSVGEFGLDLDLDRLFIGGPSNNLEVQIKGPTSANTIYAATTTYGGRTEDNGGSGKEITSGTTTGTSASKLIDGGASFSDAAHLNRTVWNSTFGHAKEGTGYWAKITAVDSPTQLSLSVDIFTSGDTYVIANAYSVGQEGLDALPGSINANTIVKLSDGTFSEDLILQGKQFSGAFGITINGTLTFQETVSSATVAAGTGATQGTVTKAGAFTADVYGDFLVYFVTDAVFRLIDSHTNDVLTLVGTAASSTTQDVRIYSWGTILSGTTTAMTIRGGQQAVTLQDLDLTTAATNALAVNTKSIISMNRCTGDSRYLFQTGADVTMELSYLSWGTSDRIVFVQNSSLTVRQSKFHSGTVDKLGLTADNGSIVFVNGSILSGAGISAASKGITGTLGSNFNFFSGAAAGYPRIRDWDIGLNVGTGAQAIFTQTAGAPHVVYSGNTSDRVQDTTKSAHYNDTV